MSLKRITVLVSCSKHPISGAPRHHQNDSLALQLALNLASKYAATLQVLHAGDATNPALQDYLALGASQIDVISTAGNLVDNIADQLKNTDLILTGSRAANAEDSGLLPYLLAAKLNLSIVTSALEIDLYENSARKNIASENIVRENLVRKNTSHDNHADINKLEVLQFLPKGQRRRVALALPALVAVHPLATVKLRFVHAQRNTGHINVLAKQNSDADNSARATRWITEAPRKAIKLKAKIKQTGHERLMDAISSKTKGGTVVNDENNVEKAQVILRYLREHQLTKF
jgi:electron transfer flavoprotein beta subunit